MYWKNRIRMFSLSIIILGIGVSSVMAQNILIVSTSHGNTGPSEVREADGVLKLVISTFSPISEVRLNDEIQPAQSSTVSRLEIPYQLKAGENRFNVVVKTDEAEQQKVFILNYVTPELNKMEAPMKSPFRLITAAGLTYTDNASAAKSNKTAGTKLSVTVIPQYRYELGQSSDLLFQGLMLREKYSDSDLEALETVLTRVGVDWMNQSGFGDWQVSAGWSDIGGKTSGLAADTKVGTEMVLGGSVRLNSLDRKKVRLGLKYTLRNAAETSAAEYDGDGGLLNINAGWNRKFGTISSEVKGGYDLNDAKGRYEDYSATNLGIKAKYPLNRQLTLGGRLSSRQTSYKEEDLLKGAQEASTLSILSVNGAYKMPSLFGMIAVGDLTQKLQSSNVASKEYSELLVSISMIYVY